MLKLFLPRTQRLSLLPAGYYHSYGSANISLERFKV